MARVDGSWPEGWNGSLWCTHHSGAILVPPSCRPLDPPCPASNASSARCHCRPARLAGWLWVEKSGLTMLAVLLHRDVWLACILPHTFNTYQTRAACWSFLHRHPDQDYCRSVPMVGATQVWCTNKDDLSLGIANDRACVSPGMHATSMCVRERASVCACTSESLSAI